MMTWPIVAAVARRPRLWAEAVRAAVALSPRRWWARFPFVPRPDRRYLEWRIATAYGRHDAPIASDDVISYLRWRKRQRMAGAAAGTAGEA